LANTYSASKVGRCRNNRERRLCRIEPDIRVGNASPPHRSACIACPITASHFPQAAFHILPSDRTSLRPPHITLGPDLVFGPDLRTLSAGCFPHITLGSDLVNNRERRLCRIEPGIRVGNASPLHRSACVACPVTASHFLQAAFHILPSDRIFLPGSCAIRGGHASEGGRRPEPSEAPLTRTGRAMHLHAFSVGGAMTTPNEINVPKDHGRATNVAGLIGEQANSVALRRTERR
jgi:hypothetical protein